MDLVLGPYSSPISEAVADVNEKQRMPMVAPIAAATSIYKKGRKYIFSVLPPVEIFLEGLIDMAVKKGLKTVAMINVDDLSQSALAQGTIKLAKKKGLQRGLRRGLPPGERRLLRDPDQGPRGES